LHSIAFVNPPAFVTEGIFPRKIWWWWWCYISQSYIQAHIKLQSKSSL